MTERSQIDHAQRLFEAQQHRLHSRMDRFFASLLVLQFFAGLGVARWLAPLTWAGAESAPHMHLRAALLLGGAITALPLYLACVAPGRTSTRHVIAVAQAMSSGLLIHLTGGRIETHFLIFGSLAFLSFYRDWRVLMTASAVVALDHFLRGTYWPQSIFGVASAAPWRWLEHAGWVVFEDVFLVLACLQGQAEMRQSTAHRAHLEVTRAGIEDTVAERTARLERANLALREEMQERERLEEERDRLNIELGQAQKLEAIGQLAAGIAHEINTPVQFVTDNTRFVKESVGDLLPILHRVSEAAADDDTGRRAAAVAALRPELEEADLEFLNAEIPSALDQSLEGLDRIASIVRAMKDFSHPGVEGKAAVNLNSAIESTITVARNEWKYVAEVETELDPDLPQVTCLINEVNQVVLNLLVNAAHAIGAREDGEKGRIRVATTRVGDSVEIEITDDGGGIPPEARDRIFEPFFTTKEVGRGTGQGLAIAYNVVVKKHGGELTFDTEIGRGTTFRVRLPIDDPATQAAA